MQILFCVPRYSGCGYVADAASFGNAKNPVCPSCKKDYPVMDVTDYGGFGHGIKHLARTSEELYDIYKRIRDLEKGSEAEHEYRDPGYYDDDHDPFAYIGDNQY